MDVTCSTCGAASSDGKRFCGECGSALTLTCPHCGGRVEPGRRFCGDCGGALGVSGVSDVASSPDISPSAAVSGPGVAALRWVSVVFVDLVGSTALAEGRDPADVREVLGGYFEASSAVVARFGGRVEKFIGDAVVAVWGSQAAREDDAVRAVRAALEVVAAVEAYGESVGVPLGARVGVVTGQVAAWAVEQQGLVAGDRVNTAARVQSLAEPGQVWVDEATRQSSRSVIDFADAGVHTVKGKTEELHLWRATGVAGVAGARREDDLLLHPPLVGRARDLGVVKELFHACAEDARARLVMVVGEAGIGKTRVAEEFQAYVDGLPGTVWWHSTRCPSYGDGVPLWALSQLIRQRFGLLETDPAEVATARLDELLAGWIPEPDEYAFTRRALASLLGIPDTADRAAPERAELFGGWRLLLERLAGVQPLVWVIDDLHWADSALVDFVDYLLDWSAEYPLFLLALTRPEFHDNYPDFAVSRRNTATWHLDPLSKHALAQLLQALVPKMPSQSETALIERAAGVPLYAVEMLRSLRDQGVLNATPDGTYELLADKVTQLDVPVTLTALLTARLDALPPAERELIQGLAVLGSTFTRAAVPAVTDRTDDEVNALLITLRARQILTIRTDRLCCVV